MWHPKQPFQIAENVNKILFNLLKLETLVCSEKRACNVSVLCVLYDCILVILAFVDPKRRMLIFVSIIEIKLYHLLTPKNI